MEPVIFFAPPPNLDELCGITVCVKPINAPHLNLPPATLQPHIIKCREMIFTEPDVIASPSYDLDSCFNMILQQSVLQTGRVHTRLKKQGLELSKPYKVHPYLYQSCLRYTVIARLAPAWNKAGEWLIQGRNFLVHSGYTNAIKMSLCVNKDEMYISLIGTAVKFPPLQVEDLNLSQEEMRNILKSTESEITKAVLADCWCHVLPSMKTGQISSLSVTIPRDSPFKSYKDLKRHWKNMYGYRLPETDEDVLYCQVGFMASGGGKQFTYPSVCLRAGPLQVIQRVDPKPILTSFLQDIHSKGKSICGNLMRFQPKIRYAVTSLHLATEETKQASIKAKSRKNKAAPLRSVKSLAHLYSYGQGEKGSSYKKQMQDQENSQIDMCSGSTTNNIYTTSSPEKQSSVTYIRETQSSRVSTNECVLVKDTNTNIESTVNGGLCDTQIAPSPDIHRSSQSKDVYLKQQLKETPFSSQQEVSKLQFHQGLDKMSTQSTSGAKLFPLFRPKAKQSCSKIKTCPLFKDSNSKPLIPTFKPKTLTQLAHEDKDETNTLSPQLCNPVQVSPTKTPASSTPDQYYFKTSNSQSEKPERVKCSKLSLKHNIKSPFVEHIQQSPLENSNGVISRATSSDLKSTSNSPKQPAFGKSFSVMPLSALPQACRSSDGGTKRKKILECDSSMKKPRAKPQIQDLNVESLARVNQLNKVNNATLAAWLKERGVTCKSKDKKIDLVEKIIKYLDITTSEP